MDNALPTHPYLTHPLTGCPLQAVGIVAGRPVWPILGGDGTGAGGDGGDGGGDGGDGGQGGDSYTPPATQEEFDSIFEARLARERNKLARQYGNLSPDQVQVALEKAGRMDELELELSGEMEKATHRASEDGYQAAMSLMVPRLIQQEFRHQGEGAGMTDEQITSLLEDLDLAKYADDEGEPDLVAIKAKVEKFAPPRRGNEGTRYVVPPINLGQGRQPAAVTQPGDQGRAMAAKRFGKK